jgi:hypothetical protein
MQDIAMWCEARHSMLLLLASLVSALFIVLQIYILTRSIRGQTYQRIYESMITIDKFFIENPRLKGYFYPDAEEPEEDVDQDKLFSIAEMLTDYFDSVYHQKNTMPRHTFEGFIDYMRSVYKHSRVLRAYLDLPSRNNWYPEKFVAALKAGPRSAVIRSK